MAATALHTRSVRFGMDFGHVYAGSDISRKRRRQKTVTWPHDEKICEVRSFLIDDAPSMLGVVVPDFLQCGQGDPLSYKKAHHPPSFRVMEAKRARMEQVNQLMDVPPGFGLISTAGKPPQSKTKTHAAMALTVPWHCPQKFLVGASWLWAGGEESSEVASQQEREKRTLEAFYPRVASIPDSPLEPQEPSKEIDDVLVSQIPLVPFEEEMEDMMEQQSISPEKGGTGSHKSAEHREMADALTPSNGILHNVFAKQQQYSGMSFADANIAAAAAAAYMVLKARGESDILDEALLVKLVKNPSLLSSLTCSKEYMRGESQNQDSGIACRSAAHQESVVHKLPPDQGAYLDRSPVSVLVPWGDCDTRNDTHRMAPIANANTRMQHSTFLSSMSTKLLAPTITQTLYPCSDPELCRDSEKKSVECIPRVHEKIPENSVMNSGGRSNLKEASSMHAYVPREDMRSKNGSSKASQLYTMQAAMTSSSPFSVHSNLTHSNSVQGEPPKRMSAEDRSFPGAAARNVSSKTGGRPKRFCLYFNTLRGCRNGDSCAFVH